MNEAKLKLRDSVIANMISLGTYKTEYDQLIEIYAGMLHQYFLFEEEFGCC